MGISSAGHNPNYNIMQHPNVLLGNLNNDVPKDMCQTNSALYSVLHPLLSARPNWRFLAMTASDTTNNVRVVNHFTITEDGEVLGDVDIDWKGRGYKIRVTNERITKERHKGRSYYTEKPEKATLAIRKNFFRLAITERVEKARSDAYAVINTEANGKESRLRSATDSLFFDARKFCEQHLDEYVAFANKHAVYQNIQRHKEERDCTHAIKKAFDTDKTYLVVLDLSQYIVFDQQDNTRTFDDETLPDDIRGKLGLLKLVQPKQMVSNVGCRVSDTVFVVAKEEAK